MFLLLVQSFSLLSQESKSVRDTLLIKKDTITTDTSSTKVRKTSTSAVDSKITYKSADLIKRDIINKKYENESLVRHREKGYNG